MSFEFISPQSTRSITEFFILLRPQAMKELCGTLCTPWCNSLVATVVSSTSTLQRYRYEKRKSSISGYFFGLISFLKSIFQNLLAIPRNREDECSGVGFPFNLSAFQLFGMALKRWEKIFIILYIINYLFYSVFILFSFLNN